jgi:hypothetical protein
MLKLNSLLVAVVGLLAVLSTVQSGNAVLSKSKSNGI